MFIGRSFDEDADRVTDENNPKCSSSDADLDDDANDKKDIANDDRDRASDKSDEARDSDVSN